MSVTVLPYSHGTAAKSLQIYLIAGKNAEKTCEFDIFEVLESVNTFVNTHGRIGPLLPAIMVNKRHDRMLKAL